MYHCFICYLYVLYWLKPFYAFSVYFQITALFCYFQNWDFSFLTENGLLSYANPNYQLTASDENCNIEADDGFDDLYEDLDIACRVNRRSGIHNRRSYATLDPSSMGVDVEVETTPMLSINAENNLWVSAIFVSLVSLINLFQSF